MFKGENIDVLLMRIAEQELGIQIDTANKIAKVNLWEGFKNRISTRYFLGYLVKFI